MTDSPNIVVLHGQTLNPGDNPWDAVSALGRLTVYDRTPADQIVICSYHYASRNKRLIAQVPWDLVVIDEAHRLRNVYKPSNVIANTLKQALASAPKLPSVTVWPATERIGKTTEPFSRDHLKHALPAWPPVWISTR